MRDVLLKIFQFDKGPEITLFSIWHIMYLVLIIGLTIALACFLNKKTDDFKRKIVNIIAVSVISVYIADFFIMPLSRVNDDPTRQLLDVDKLPFHLCTLIGVIIPFAQFNTKLKNNSSFKEVLSCLAIASTLMYIVYPGSAIGDISTFSYKVVQTFVFHGLVFSWGFLTLSTGAATLKIKNIWKQAVGILIVMLWATFGNYAYYSELFSCECNFCFLKVSFFSFIPDSMMPLAFFVAVFGVVSVIYGIYYATLKIISKLKTSKISEETN